MSAHALEQIGEWLLLRAYKVDQPHILREEREQASHQKIGDILSVVTCGLETLGQLCEFFRDLARDLRAMPGGIERERFGPERGEAFADFFIGQSIERNAVGLNIREGGVGLSEAGEIRVQLDHVPDIDHHDKRRIALVRRQ